MHDLMLSRIADVLSAAQMLDAIMNSGEAVAPDFIVDLLTFLQSTISTQKKSETETAVTMVSGIGLFDEDIDSAGADLGIWHEVPRHPMVVALAVKAKINNATFSPSLAEVASSCRWTKYQIEKGFGAVLDWLDQFNRLDAALGDLIAARSHDEWARNLTLEKIATIEAIDELLRYFKRKIATSSTRPDCRIRSRSRDISLLREKFLAAIKNKLTLGDDPILSDEEVEVIASECGWPSWRTQEAKAREEHERYLEALEEERRKKEQRHKQERLWEKRRHHCAFCNKSEKAVAQLFGINLLAPPAPDRLSIAQVGC